MEKHIPGNDRTYEAPQAEIIVCQLERRFMGDSTQTDFSGNYHLQNGGLENGGELSDLT